MNEFSDKVAFVTGAARGQGRSHALRLAELGVDIIAIDRCSDISSVPYTLASRADLDDTVREIEKRDRRALAADVDVRDRGQTAEFLGQAVADLGRLDFVVANAGVLSFSPVENMPDEMWHDMIDVNLTGVFNAVRVSISHLRSTSGGAIAVTGSTASTRAAGNLAHYSAAKHGVLGLVRSLAIELGPSAIRVNAVMPTTVGTGMVMNKGMYRLLNPDMADPGKDDFAATMRNLHVLPTPWVEVEDVTNAVEFLLSSKARFITGIGLPVDAGWLIH